MAIIFDYPFNEAGILAEADQLLEKNYIDQAICMLEEGLSKTRSHEIRKRLLSCYLLKQEFTSCEGIILELNELGCLDLSMAAHDILVSLFQQDDQAAALKKDSYLKRLKLSAFGQKNLTEMIYQLKLDYEEGWVGPIARKFQTLADPDASFEKKASLISDLQEVDTQILLHFQHEFRQFFENETQPVLRTMGFELAVLRGLDLEAAFGARVLPSSPEALKPFAEGVEGTLAWAAGHLEDEASLAFIQAHLVLFHQFCFPDFVKVSHEETVRELCGVLLEANFSYPAKKGRNDALAEKIEQYMATLLVIM